MPGSNPVYVMLGDDHESITRQHALKILKESLMIPHTFFDNGTYMYIHIIYDIF